MTTLQTICIDYGQAQNDGERMCKLGLGLKLQARREGRSFFNFLSIGAVSFRIRVDVEVVPPELGMKVKAAFDQIEGKMWWMKHNIQQDGANPRLTYITNCRLRA